MCLISGGYLSLLTVLKSGVVMTLPRHTCRYIDVAYLCLYAIYFAKVSPCFPVLTQSLICSAPAPL